MSPTEKAALTGAFIFGGIAALAFLKWLATLGDKKWAARRTRLGAATPAYTTPPRRWADEDGRPY